MPTNENLEAKYGRRKTPSDTSVETKEEIGISKESGSVFQKYGRKKVEEHDSESPLNTEKEDKIPQEKTIEENIKDTLSKYNSDKKENINTGSSSVRRKRVQEESVTVKFLKAVIIVLIIVIASSIIIAFTMRPKINLEGEQIIEQIKKAETLYFSVQKKYHYFAKTNYDSTLGVDLNKYKYFTFYEVVPNEESKNYEVKLYGATNAFTITFYTVKAFFKEKF